MRILALEPYFGGSHQAFLEGWSRRSRHHWDLLTLPAFRWKWRMRHAAITFAEDVRRRVESGETWDLVFCSDMLDLAGFKGLAPSPVSRLPAVVYFHENQLTYPERFRQERDYHFGLTNMTTGLASDRVWFNSAFHRDSFLRALESLLQRITDHAPHHVLDAIRGKVAVWPQGVEAAPTRGPRAPGPLRVLWAARWEHDKNPETFFQALQVLRGRGVPFWLSVIGERFRQTPPVFEQAREEFREHIDNWGYQTTREAYTEVLLSADVVVSTARHEFFGVSMVEAVAAGAFPLVPRRLAYPEILDAAANPRFFYDGEAGHLADRLEELAGKLDTDGLWDGDAQAGVRLVRRYLWENLVPELDDAVEACCCRT